MTHYQLRLFCPASDEGHSIVLHCEPWQATCVASRVAAAISEFAANPDIHAVELRDNEDCQIYFARLQARDRGGHP
jgi:hypothetical protein